MKKVSINGQWQIVLPNHRVDQWEGSWEEERLNSMHHWVKAFVKQNNRKPVVYYIGAEQGDMCGLLALWGAELVMIEPNPSVWPNIRAIWEANKLDTPRLAWPGFASSHSDEPVVFVERMWPECANGGITDKHDFKNLCEADGTIPQMKIDDLVDAMELPPDMISSDAEGAEWEVLRGAEKTLSLYGPTIYLSLHPEFMYEIYKEYSADLRYWLKKMGYKETLLDWQHEGHFLYEIGESTKNG